MKQTSLNFTHSYCLNYWPTNVFCSTTQPLLHLLPSPNFSSPLPSPNPPSPTDLQQGKGGLKHGRHAVTEVDVHELEDQREGELCREESEEPLGGKHVQFYTVLGEVVVEVWHVLLCERGRGGGRD